MNSYDFDSFRAWREKAEEDNKAAQVLLQHGGPPATVCFLCHQLVEKYLKGFALLNKGALKRVHQLDLLLEDCIAIDATFRGLIDDAATLKRYYLTSRYPDDLPEDIPEAEAIAAHDAASRIRAFVLDRVQKAVQAHGSEESETGEQVQ